MRCIDALKSIDQHELAGLALFIGVLFFAVVSSVLLVRTYDRLEPQRVRATDAEAAALAREIDRLYDVILSEPQVVVGVEQRRSGNHRRPRDPRAGPRGRPSPGLCRLAASRAGVAPRNPCRPAVGAERGASAISLTTALGRYLTAEGHAIGGSAVLKLADVEHGVKRDLADLVHHHQQLQVEAAALRAVIEALPAPA